MSLMFCCASAGAAKGVRPITAATQAATVMVRFIDGSLVVNGWCATEPPVEDNGGGVACVLLRFGWNAFLDVKQPFDYFWTAGRLDCKKATFSADLCPAR